MTLHELSRAIDTGLLTLSAFVIVGFIINGLVDWLGLDKHLGINR